MKARIVLLIATLSMIAAAFFYSQYLIPASYAISNLQAKSLDYFSHQENLKESAPIHQESNEGNNFAREKNPQAQSTSVKKSVLIKYTQWPGDGVDEIISCIAGWGPLPQFILYNDGQLIQSCCRCGYFETYISQQEMDNLFQRIKETGFFDLSLKPGSIEDIDIYQIPEGVKFGDGGWGMTLSVKDVAIGIHPQKAEYLVKPIQDTLSIITNFQANEKMKPFIPDEVQLFILDGTNKDIQEYFSEYIPKQEATISEWPLELPSLALDDNTMGFGHLDQNQIATSLELKVFSHFPEVKRFSQTGHTYIVIPCISSIE